MNFEWSLPTRIHFGPGRFHSTGKLVKGMGKRCFIVTSASFKSNGSRHALLKALEEQLNSVGIESDVFSEIEPNPRTSTIDRAGAQARSFKPRFIIAFGGGSVMDASKCIALLCENEGPIWDYAYKGPGKPRTLFNHALPLVCIPTIAATSSETDPYGVVTNWELKIKSTVFGDPLQPALSIIDPELTYSVPLAQTIDGAIDMITHVMETYLSTRKPAPIQDALTEAIVETVIKWLPVVIENPKHELGRSQLSWCSSLALSGILSGREGGWPVHALEHGLSACTDIAHGRGLALLLPRIMLQDAQVIPEKIAHFNRKIFGTTVNDPILACKQGFFKFMKDVNSWWTLERVGVKNHDAKHIIEKTIEHALQVDGIFKRDLPQPYIENIKPIDEDVARQILIHCTQEEFC